ncbi:MAG: hypothetical protein CSA66_03205 [Proteobacteria bacterium]|nr:MAG: hypothetical protein CSA66_03205 [Pseudomonadota bacterium]
MSWDSYPVERDGRRHYLTWHIPTYGRAPDRTRPVRIDVTVKPREVDEEGLPTEAERARLAALTEALEIDLCDATDGKYVLRTTGGGLQVHSFYTPRVRGLFRKKRCEVIAAGVVADVAEEFEGYELSARASEDEEWQAYLEAFPSTDAVQWFEDANAIARLHAEGDPLTGPRQVDHFLYFEDAEQRAAYAERAVTAGFEVAEELDDDDDPDRTCGLVIRRIEQSLDVQRVHPPALQLIALLDEIRGAYDRWEAAPPPTGAMGAMGAAEAHGG